MKNPFYYVGNILRKQYNIKIPKIYLFLFNLKFWVDRTYEAEAQFHFIWLQLNFEKNFYQIKYPLHWA